MVRKQFLTIAFLLLVTSGLKAQNYNDIGALESGIQPVVSYQNSDSTLNILHSRLHFDIPVFWNRIEAATLGFSGNMLMLDEGADYTALTNYYAAGLMFKYQRISLKNEKIHYIFYLNPLVASDFVDISLDDVQARAGLFLRIKQHRNLSYTIGLQYQHEYGGPYLLPTIGINWNPVPWFQLYFNAPYEANMEFMLAKRFSMGFSYHNNLSSYRLSKEENADYIEKLTSSGSIFFDYYFKQNFIIRLRGGYVFENELFRYAKDDVVEANVANFYYYPENSRQASRMPLTEALFGSLRFSYRLYFDR